MSAPRDEMSRDEWRNFIATMDMLGLYLSANATLRRVPKVAVVEMLFGNFLAGLKRIGDAPAPEFVAEPPIDLDFDKPATRRAFRVIQGGATT